MAKAGTPSTAISRPAEGLPIRVVCERNAGALWEACVVCKRNVARDLDDLRRFFASAPSTSRVWPRPAEKHHLAAYKDAQAALAAWFRGYLEQQGEFELSARPGNRLAERQRIPASAIGDLEFDCEEGTAPAGEGSPPLYDMRVLLPSDHAVSVPVPAEAAKPTVDVSPKAWITDMFKRMKEAGELPAGITDCSRALHGRMKDAHKKDPNLRVLAQRSIENGLRDWGLWRPGSTK
jgi:hypothetical protein